MAAGAIGPGDCSPGSTEADRPALVSRHYWRRGATRWQVTHSLRDMNPVIVTGSDGWPSCGRRTAVTARFRKG